MRIKILVLLGCLSLVIISAVASDATTAEVTTDSAVTVVETTEETTPTEEVVVAEPAVVSSTDADVSATTQSPDSSEIANEAAVDVTVVETAEVVTPVETEVEWFDSDGDHEEMFIGHESEQIHQDLLDKIKEGVNNIDIDIDGSLSSLGKTIEDFNLEDMIPSFLGAQNLAQSYENNLNSILVLADEAAVATEEATTTTDTTATTEVATTEGTTDASVTTETATTDATTTTETATTDASATTEPAATETAATDATTTTETATTDATTTTEVTATEGSTDTSATTEATATEVVTTDNSAATTTDATVEVTTSEATTVVETPAAETSTTTTTTTTAANTNADGTCTYCSINNTCSTEEQCQAYIAKINDSLEKIETDHVASKALYVLAFFIAMLFLGVLIWRTVSCIRNKRSSAVEEPLINHTTN